MPQIVIEWFAEIPFDYSPSQFYILLAIILHWEKTNNLSAVDNQIIGVVYSKKRCLFLWAIFCKVKKNQYHKSCFNGNMMALQGLLNCIQMFILLHQYKFLQEVETSAEWHTWHYSLSYVLPLSTSKKKIIIYVYIYIKDEHYFKRTNLENVGCIVLYVLLFVLVHMSCSFSRTQRDFCSGFFWVVTRHIITEIGLVWDALVGIGPFDLHSSLYHWQTSTLRIT